MRSGVHPQHLTISRDVFVANYANKWTDQFDAMFREQANTTVRELDRIFRANPAFRVKADLSNLGADDLLPGTAPIGEEIRSVVREEFAAFKRAKHP